MAKSIRCSECNAEFADAHSLAAHAAVTHLAWLPYACALGCEHFFVPTRRLLVEHCAATHADCLPAYRYVVDAAKERHWSDIVRRSLKAVTPQSEGMAHETDVQGGGVEEEEVAVQPDAHPPRRRRPNAVAHPRAVSASNPQAKARRRKVCGSVAVRCNECGASCSGESLMMAHVARYHVDGFVFRCSACHYSAKWRTNVHRHFHASSHDQAQVVSNADQLLPAVRAAFIQCFGEAAAKQSSALRKYEQEGEVEKSTGASVGADSVELTAQTSAVAPVGRRSSLRVVAAQRQRRKLAAVPKEQRASSAGERARRVKAAAAKGPSSVCRLCRTVVKCCSGGCRLTHVTDFHVDGIVYSCSKCDHTAKLHAAIGSHIRGRRKQGSHKRAKVLSNRDQLEAAVRAAYAKCFGTAAVRRSRALCSKVKALAVSSDTSATLQSAAAGESAADENAGENDEAAESDKGNEAAAAADESAGETGASSSGADEPAVVYRVLPKLIPIGCRCGRKGCMDIEWVVPPLKHKPFPLLVKQEDLDADG